jgi:hypothetical protein
MNKTDKTKERQAKLPTLFVEELEEVQGGKQVTKVPPSTPNGIGPTTQMLGEEG